MALLGAILKGYSETEMKKLLLGLVLAVQLLSVPVTAGARTAVLWNGEGRGALSKSVMAAMADIDVPQAVVPAAPSKPASAKPKPAAGKKTSLKAPRVVFSENEYISGHILKNINNCTQTLDVAVYAFSLQDVAEAMVKAVARGVKVRVIVDQAHMFSKPTKELQFLVEKGIELRTLRGTGLWGIMHNKIAIFDGKMVKFGSFNWTNVGDRNNYENAIFNTEPAVIAGYQAYFDWMWGRTRSLADGPVVGDVPWGSYEGIPTDPQPSIAFNGETFPRYAFSPLGGCEQNVIAAINASQQTIHICMYSLFSQKVGDALLAAKNRGVEVKVVMDRLQSGSSPLTRFFVENKFDFKWVGGYSGKGVMHHKFGVFDGALVITGSFNWTPSAQNNNLENDYYTDNAADAKAFAAEFGTVYGKAFTPTASDLKKLRPLSRGLESAENREVD